MPARGLWTVIGFMLTALLSAAPDTRRDDATRAVKAAAALAAKNDGDARRAALAEYQTALRLWAEIGDDREQASTLMRIADIFNDSGNHKDALEYVRRALPFWRAAGDRAGEAEALGDLGLMLTYMDKPLEGRVSIERAVELRRSLHDASALAEALNKLAITYSANSDEQTAIRYYAEAAAVAHAAGDTREEGLIVKNMASDYAALGEPERAIEFHRRAIALQQKLGDRHREALNLAGIGDAFRQLNRHRQALSYYERALAIVRTLDDRYWEARIVNNEGLAWSELGDARKALDCYRRASELKRGQAGAASEGMTLANIGRAYLELGELSQARQSLEKALPMVEGSRAEPTALVYMARIERELGNLESARSYIETALLLTENRRRAVASPQLRASYFALMRSNYDLWIEILMALDHARPGQGFEVQALAASERARVRGLLEELEDNAGLGASLPPELLRREKALRAVLTDSTVRQVRLQVSRHTPEDTVKAEEAVRSATAQHEQVMEEIRAVKAQYADLFHARPLDVSDIQGLLDTDTVLLEYALCDRTSYLWIVTRDTLSSYTLPNRATLEAAIRSVYGAIVTKQRPPGLRRLSDLLLGPAKDEIASHKRVAIVAEGALQYLPFDALPQPGPTAPLVARHEIVNLPSASALGALRRQAGRRTPAPKLFAALADPVFQAVDSRLSKPPETTAARLLPAELQRSTGDLGLHELPRLIASRYEAQSIAALVPAAQTYVALDFRASRKALFSPELRDYRIIHLATHGLLDSRHPEYSGLVFSLVDERGRPQNGFVESHEIYNLQLKADLVVLSACQTALGKDIRGEGLMSMARGFMYAGAPRVLATLWRVPDPASAALMKHFYEGMLRRRLPAAAALRSAQDQLRSQPRWSAPYYWAGYVLEGDWN